MAKRQDTAISPTPAASKLTKVGPYVVGKTLGSGCTGEVKLAYHKDSGHQVAIKIISKAMLIERPSMLKKVEREIAVMKALDHPNVLHLIDVYESSEFLLLVLEYVEGGELFDFLVSRGVLRPEEALYFFHQLIEGLDYCHSHMICHRDLKPENLLLDKNMNIKLADFGMATLMKDDFLLTSCGSPHYASPEVVMGHKYAGRKSDIWSCGVILFAMTTGKLPFDDDNIRRLLAKVKNGVFTIPKFLHPEVADLILRMLVADPARRISIKEIKQHPFWLSRSYTSPRVIVPVEEMLFDISPVSPPESIDEEIVLSLMSLGWSPDDEDALVARLCGERCLELAFYRILERQKQHSSKVPQEDKRAAAQPTPFQNSATTPRQRSGSHSSADGAESDKIPSSVAPSSASSSSSAPSGSASKPLDAVEERRRLPRDKRQGSVKNLIALLGRKPTQADLRQATQTSGPSGHPKISAPAGKENVAEGVQVEVSTGGESSRSSKKRERKKSKLRIDESKKDKSKGKEKQKEKQKEKEKGKERITLGGRIGSILHRQGKDISHEGPLTERKEPRRTADIISDAEGSGDSMVVDVEKREGDPRQIHRTLSTGMTKGSRKSLWRNISSKGVRDSISPRSTRIDDASASRISRLPSKEPSASAASVSSSSNSGGGGAVGGGGSGEETARRSWFSTFIRQQKVPAGSIPTRVQLSTNHSRLNVVHQFINLLFGTNDVAFSFDSKKYRFTVEHTKVECRFTITLREEVSSPMVDTERDRTPGWPLVDVRNAPAGGETSRPSIQLAASSPVSLVSADQRDVASREDQFMPIDSTRASSDVDHAEVRGVRIAEEGGGGEVSAKDQKAQNRYSAVLSDSVSKRKSIRPNLISVELHMDKLDPDLNHSSVVTRTLIDVDFKDGDLALYQSICNGLRKLLDL